MGSPHEMQSPAGGPGFAERDGLDSDNVVMPPLPKKNKTKTARARLLGALLKGSVSTLEAQEELGIINSPALVSQLRKKGHVITSVRGTGVYKCDGENCKRVARYTLQEAVAG